MRDETSGILEVRVWLIDGNDRVLIGERFRTADGRISVTWHVDPKSTLGVMWFEDFSNPAEVSAS